MKRKYFKVQEHMAKSLRIDEHILKARKMKIKSENLQWVGKKYEQSDEIWKLEICKCMQIFAIEFDVLSFESFLFFCSTFLWGFSHDIDLGLVVQLQARDLINPSIFKSLASNFLFT